MTNQIRAVSPHGYVYVWKHWLEFLEFINLVRVRYLKWKVLASKNGFFDVRTLCLVLTPYLFLKNYRYIFVTEKISYLINLFLNWGSPCTNIYSLRWLQRCVTWYRYYNISLGPDRSQFWKCWINSVVSSKNRKRVRLDQESHTIL